MERAPTIGPRLREARAAKGLSLAALAAEVGLTKGFISQVERDLTSPSVGTLLRLCAALDLAPGDLFGGKETPLVRAADRAPIVFGGNGMSEYRLTPSSETRVMVLSSEIAPGGGSGDEAYALDADVEVLHVMEGLLDVEVGRTEYRLAAGDTLTFPAREPHRWHNPSAAVPARVLWVLSPGLDRRRS